MRVILPSILSFFTFIIQVFARIVSIKRIIDIYSASIPMSFVDRKE